MALLPQDKKPRAARVLVVNPTLVTEPQNRARQVQDLAVQYFALRYDYPVMTRDQAAPLVAFLAALGGRAGEFQTVLPGHEQPRGAGLAAVQPGGPAVINRENHLADSSDYQGWTENFCTVFPNATPAPLGGGQAQLLVGTSGGASDSRSQAAGTFAGDDVCSVYLAPYTTGQRVGVNLYDATATAAHYATFEWNGSVLTLQDSGAVDAVVIEVIPSGSGNWHRVSLYVDATTRGIVGNSRVCYLYPDRTGLGGAAAFWCAQVEDGRTHPGPYLETSGGAITSEPNKGATLYSQLWTPATAGLLLPGDYLKLPAHSKVYQVTGEVVSDAYGVAPIPIAPVLYSTPTEGDVIQLENIPFNVALTKDEQGHDINTALHYGLTVEMAEVW